MLMNQYRDYLQKHYIEGMENEALRGYTSLEIGGVAGMVVKPKCEAEIQLAMREAIRLGLPICMIGNGSNILVDDRGYDGVVIVTPTYFHDIQLLPHNIIQAQAGASLKSVCLFALQYNLSGLEFAYGIPASVGGAVYMNAGAYGGEMKDVLISAQYLDEVGNQYVRTVSELDFDYRCSFFTDRQVCVTSALFQLHPAKHDDVKQKMDELLARRIAKQPLEYASAGSTFKRPKGNYASALIEQCGLKGYRIGDAMVSDKHAGFLINVNHATSDDFKRLIAHVQNEVYRQSGYQLACEVKILPFQSSYHPM